MDMLFYVIISVIILYFVYTAHYWITELNDFSFLNPIVNYKEWTSFNWFGVIVCTLFLNILWLPYAIIYWIYELIHFLFTVGRGR